MGRRWEWTVTGVDRIKVCHMHSENVTTDQLCCMIKVYSQNVKKSRASRFYCYRSWEKVQGPIWKIT